MNRAASAADGLGLTVATFYKFARVDDPGALRRDLEDFASSLSIRGTILIAAEGLNATVSGTSEAVAALLARLRAEPRFADLLSKEQLAETHPFRRLKVKVKPEILTFGLPEADPATRTGTYVAPEDWNALITDPDVTFIDTRNAYEVAVGTFPGALDPATRTFGDFARFADENLDSARHPKIAMFCTGGIRCEKASAFLLARGFPEVLQLRGGILNYLERVPVEASLWRGDCFVFDERGAVGAAIAD